MFSSLGVSGIKGDLGKSSCMTIAVNRAMRIRFCAQVNKVAVDSVPMPSLVFRAIAVAKDIVAEQA